MNFRLLLRKKTRVFIYDSLKRSARKDRHRFYVNESSRSMQVVLKEMRYNLVDMTQPQATAEVFWTAFRAMKPSERKAFVAKLMTDKTFGEDLRYAAIITKRRNEPTVSLDDYLASRTKKK